MRWIGGCLCLLMMGCAADPETPSDSSGFPEGAGASGSGGATTGAGGTRGGSGGGAAGSGGAAKDGGSGATGGRSGTGGSATGGSQAGSGGGSATGGGDSGQPFVPVTCPAQIGDLPAGSPKLTPGVLTEISPTKGAYWANGIVFDKCNPAVLYTTGGNYAGAGGPGDQHGVYRSTDAGSTWLLLVSLDSPARVRVDPANPNNLYVIDGVNGRTMGFWRSTDGGKNWEQPQGFKDAAGAPTINCYDGYDIEPDPTDFKHALMTFHSPWAAYDYASGVFETTDGGDSWAAHEPLAAWKGGYGYNAFFLYDPEHGIGNGRTWLFTSQAGGYYRTTDAGGSWTKVSDEGQAHGGAQHYYAPDGVLYVTTGHGLVKSTDNGATFSTVLPTGNTFSQFLGMTGDGRRLFTGASVGGALLTADLAKDTSWSNYASVNFAQQGPYEMNYDAAHGILYSANALGELWALKL